MRPALTNALTNAIREALNYSSTSLEPEPVINYVARLDGFSQNWVLSSPITVSEGQRIELSVYGVTRDSTRMTLLGATDDLGGQGSYHIHDSGNIQLRDRNNRESATVVIDDTGSNSFTADGLPHLTSAVIDAGKDATYNLMGVSPNGDTFRYYLSGAVYNIKHYDTDGTLLLDLPLTNKEQGATQLATVGNVTATMANYTEAVWQKLPKFDQDPWVFVPDGEASVIDIPEAFIRTGDYFEFSFLAPTENVDDRLFGFRTGSNQLIVKFNQNGAVGYSRSIVSIDGVDMAGESNSYPTDGQVHTARVEGTSFGVISRIHTDADYNDHSIIPIWNLKIIGSDQGDFLYPLDDGPNSTELRELIQQGQGATLTQGNGIWRRLSELT